MYFRGRSTSWAGFSAKISLPKYHLQTWIFSKVLSTLCPLDCYQKVKLWSLVCGLLGHLRAGVTESGLDLCFIHSCSECVTLTFIHKSDVLLMCGSESLRWAAALLCGGTVVALPVQTVEHNLWGRRAGEIRQRNLRIWRWGAWESLQQNTKS